MFTLSVCYLENIHFPPNIQWRSKAQMCRADEYRLLNSRQNQWLSLIATLILTDTIICVYLVTHFSGTNVDVTKCVLSDPTLYYIVVINIALKNEYYQVSNISSIEWTNFRSKKKKKWMHESASSSQESSYHSLQNKHIQKRGGKKKYNLRKHLQKHKFINVLTTEPNKQTLCKYSQHY